MIGFAQESVSEFAGIRNLEERSISPIQAVAKAIFLFCVVCLLTACPPSRPAVSTGFNVVGISLASGRPLPDVDATVTIMRTAALPGDTLRVPIQLLEADGGLRFEDDLLDEGSVLIAPNSTTGVRHFVLDCSPGKTLKGRLDDSGERGPGAFGIGDDKAELYARSRISSNELPIAPC